jgi:hypothetical protein
MYWKDRSQIVKAHQVFGESMFKFSSSKSQITDIRFLAPTVAMAIIQAEYRVEQDHNLPSGEKAGTKGDISHSMLNVVLTKKNEAWKVSAVQVTTVDPRAAAHDPVVKQVSR